ncbi:MAG: flavodoxin-dependent (E)-4-hydroxy-3-methylbut-2-enyl-diphosphate synthase [Eubacteriales bacterium]|nr:flavodoxin-dependent (E)-4-hydroxy-3-methylbut-2-enyl-diphosphate synthase [Eubacteriales bacterium]
MYTREHTSVVHIGKVAVGGGNPVAVQSMTNTDTRDVDATVEQILRLEARGCEIVRASVYDEECAHAFARIKERIHIPLVADIHFSDKLAIAAVENGADKLRLNPGNIGGEDKVRKVADAARAHGVPIRVGVNAGSLEAAMQAAHGHTAQAMVNSAMGEIAILEKQGFDNIVVSLKASNVPLCLEAYRLMAQHCAYPLHIGITEAGGGDNALIKSAVGAGALLLDGLGDTLRVSLTGAPEPEVDAAWSILRASGVRRRGVEIISCPTCGRTRINVAALAAQVEQATCHITKPLKVAVMGCVVNGPGEAKEADVGIAGGDGRGVLIKGGEVVRTMAEEELLPALLAEIDTLL